MHRGLARLVGADTDGPKYAGPLQEGDAEAKGCGRDAAASATGRPAARGLTTGCAAATGRAREQPVPGEGLQTRCGRARDWTLRGTWTGDGVRGGNGTHKRTAGPADDGAAAATAGARCETCPQECKPAE